MGYLSVKRYNCMEIFYMFFFRVVWYDFLKFSIFLVIVFCGISVYCKFIVKSILVSYIIVINNRLVFVLDYDISCYVYLICV